VVDIAEKKILLVEDNPKDVELTRRALTRANIANVLVVASDGVEAIEYLLGNSTAPAELPVVVLLDLKLPRIDGLEVLRRIRNEQRTKTLPVVILTSSNEEKDIVGSYNLGANSYIRKPVKFNDFADAIKQLGLYWLVLNQPPLV
jgi:two-component system, response regulator